jgi:chemotaxis family two-component system response regulator Rcp1
MRILLVEDNPADAVLAAEAFKEAAVPIEVTVVPDGRTALAFLRREGRYATALPPDVVLLDLNLPHTDGHAVLAEIRTDPALRLLPVIILTSSRADPDMEMAYERGANSYLLKPNNLEGYYTLARSIAEFWGRWAALPART